MAQDAKLKAQSKKRTEQDPWREHRLILLSAKTQSALEQMTTNLVDHLKENPDLCLADAAYTLQVGRKVFPHRRMIVGANVKEVIRSLSSPGSEKVLTFSQEKDNRSAVFMFPGLGAQYVNMGSGLYQSEMIFRQEMDHCFKILNTLVDEDIKEILYPKHSAPSGRPFQEGSILAARNPQPETSFDKINQPGIAQLVIFIVEYSLARLLKKWGIMPRAIIGYSFGEYVAACIAGVFSLDDALKLVVFRGKLVEKIPTGAMSSVPLPRNQLEPLLDNQLSIAIDNGSSCVVSGPLAAVAAFEEQMKKRRYLCMRLPVSHALHSKMMEPILEEFKAFLGQMPLNKPQIPYISNVTGKWIKDREATDPEYWSTHLRQMVKFADGLTELVKEPGSLFIEVGPGHELSALLARQLGKDRQQQVINLVKHPDREVSDSYFLLSKIGLFWLYGIRIDWSAFYLNKKRYRIPLPTYPFEHQRYWLQGEDDENFLPAAYKQKKSDIADWFYLPQWERSQLLPVDRRKLPESSCWLVFINESVFCSKLLERLSPEVKHLITVVKGSVFQKLGESKYKINPTQSNDYRILWKELQKINRIPRVIVHLWGLCDSDGKILEKEIVDDAQDLVLYSILNLVQAVNQQAFLEEIDIHMVLNGIHEVTGEEIIIPQNATVIGLTKVIPQEYSHINCRCIDIELPEAGSVKEEKLIHQLEMEFKSNSKDNIAAYRLNYRWVQTFKSLRLETGDEDQSKLRKDGTCLIIGGLGNIGFTLAKYLAATVNAKLILTGRTELPPRSEWERYLDSHDKKDPAAVKICRILELEEKGSEVKFFSADAADYQQMLQVIAASEARFGKINGIIHAAASGGSVNRAIDEIGKKDFQHQFQAKVYGLIVLEKLFRGKELDFCLLISSPASILGGLGLAAYAAANQFIDTFVYWHNRIHFNAAPWITVNWGDWLFENEDNGDINISAKDPLAYLRMTPEQGIKTFQKILNGCPVNQVVVSAVDLQKRINDWVRLEFKQEKDKPGKNILTATHTRPHLLTPYVAPGSQMEKILSDIWKKHFAIEKVGVNDNFFELGATSLDLIQLNRRLKEVIKKDIHVGIFFKYPNIHSLALHLSQEGTSQTVLEKEVKRSDKVLRKREKIQKRTKIRKNMR
jgi:acyl transferase domain-containing protein